MTESKSVIAVENVLPFILSTGNLELDLPHKIEIAGVNGFAQIPWSPDDIARVIDEIEN